MKDTNAGLPEELASWEGTPKELRGVINELLDELQEEYNLPTKMAARRLFLEAFSRNIVQNELVEMCGYIMGRE